MLIFQLVTTLIPHQLTYQPLSTNQQVDSAGNIIRADERS